MARSPEGPGTVSGGGARSGRVPGILALSFLGALVGGAAGNAGLGLLLGAGLGMLVTNGDRPAGKGRPEPRSDPRITAFIDRAVLHGVIDRDTAFRLLEFVRRGMTSGPRRPIADIPQERLRPTAPSGAPEPQRAAPPPERTPLEPPPAGRRPIPPATRAPTSAPRPVARPASATPAPAAPPARPPSPLAIGLRRVGRSAGAMWKAFSADVAIHTVTYLGVFLLALVMFAFYGLGFYGEVISGARWRPWRPVVAAALPSLGFAVAALLRARTGIVFTANAIGFLAALALPIALSSLFQDGAPWGPPDLDGSSRWIGYAVVALVCAGVFAFAARRSTMYAYLVGPGIWTAAGALGLYLEDGIGLLRDGSLSSFAQFTSDGISWAQMAFVLLVMALTLPVARMARGGVVAARVVRSAIVCFPIVAIFGGAFAALQDPGIGLDRDAAPTVLLASVGAVAFAARGSSFAWDDSGERLRVWLGRSLEVTGLVVVAVAWIATGWLGIEAPWIGAGLAVYSAALLFGGDRLHGGGQPIIAALRLVGVIGMGMSSFDPLSCLLVFGAASVATALADWSGSWRERWIRVYPLPATSAEGSALVAALVGMSLFGAGRLAWGDAASWIVLGVSLLLAASRWLPVSAPALRGLSAWAIPIAAAGVAIGAYRWEELGTIDTPLLGVHLLAAGLVTAVAAIDWRIRLPLVTGVAVPGAALALRWFDVPPSVVDALVLSVAGVGLLALATVVGPGLSREADVLGHLLVWLAPLLGSPSDNGLMIGLFTVAVAHFGVAAVIDRGGTGQTLGMPAAPSILVHAAVGIVTLPSVAVIASQEISWFAAERPRTAFVLLGAAVLYASIVPWIRQSSARRLLWLASQVIALAAVGVAVPSSPALLVTTWSAAALFGLRAVASARPASSLPAWVLALAGSMVAAGRLGVSRGDLHEPLFAAGVALIAVGALGHRFAPRLRDWAMPPLGLGLLVMPAALAFVIADQVHVAVFSGVAAAVYAALMWLIHTGAFAPLVAAMVAVGYADILPESASAFEHPLMWLPLAAAILGVAASQPRRERGHWLAPVASGLNVTWPAVLVLAGAVSLDAGWLDRILLGSAALVALAALRWRSVPIAYASLVLLAWSGAVAGVDWLTLALAFDAIVTGVHATMRGDALARFALAPAAAALAVGALVSLGEWHQWSLTSALIADGGVVIVTASLVVLFTARPPVGRASIWVPPAAVVAQSALVTYVALGWDALGDPGRYGPLAAALAVEAVLAVASALAWQRVDMAWATAVLGAAAYVALGLWRDWSVGEALLAVGIPAVVFGAAALVIGLAPEEGRLRLWEAPFHGLAQASALAFVGIGSGGDTDPAALFTGFLVFEAATAGVIATRLRLPELTWTAAALGLGGIIAAGLWADLTVSAAVMLALSVGLAAAAFGLVAARRVEGTRMRFWRDAAIGASQVSWAVAPFLGLAQLAPETVALVAAAALGADAVFAGSVAHLLPPRLRLRFAATVMGALALTLAVGAADPDVAMGLVILLAAVGAMMLIGGSYPESALGVWGEPVLAAGWVLTVGAPLLVTARIESDAILGAVLVIGGAGIVPGAIVSGRWRAIYLGMLEWGVAVPILFGWREISDANLVVVPAAATVLTVLALERLRARLLDKPFTRDMSDAVTYTEVAAMVVPMVVAAWPAYQRPSLGHLVLLAGEAALLVVWALVTHVRRRLVWGAVGLVAVVVYPIARVLVEVFRGGITGGAMLGIGAVVALVLIVVGSLLERSRARIGDAVRRLGEALEDWS